jgi:hypothetical protein
MFLVAIAGILIAINVGGEFGERVLPCLFLLTPRVAGKQGYIGAKSERYLVLGGMNSESYTDFEPTDWSSAKVFDSDAADNWCTAFL